MVKSEVRGNGLVGDFFTEKSDQQRKAIIMLGGSEGGKSWSRVRRPIELLVQRGYALLSLAYFKSEGLPDSLEEIPLGYFEKAFDWLSAQPGIISDEYAILGGSKGSEAGLLLGSRFPQVKAVVAFSPSSVVWQGIPQKRFELGMNIKSSWSHLGESLPFLPYPSSIRKLDLLLLRLRKMHTYALHNSGMVEQAMIPVEKIQGEILLISGKRDALWPATQMGHQIMNRLKAKGFEYAHEHLVYDSGHNGILMKKECWRRIFDFLEKNFV